jgi:transcription antitermination factor NusG
MEKMWHIVYTGNPKKLAAVQNVFESLRYDFALWVPAQQVNRVIRGTNTMVAKVLFPGYVFVNFAYKGPEVEDALLDAKAGYLLKSPGIEAPAFITEKEVNHIKDLEQIRIAEVINLPKVSLGDFVEVTNGAFMGAKGTVVEVKKNSVKVELVIFGRVVAVEVSSENIYKVKEEHGR